MPSSRPLELWSPKYGRWNVSEVASGTSGTEDRRAGYRAGRRGGRPAEQAPRLGYPAKRVARCSRRTREREVEARVGQRHRPRRSPRPAGTRYRSRPWRRRAVASCAGVTSTPTGRAPRASEPGGEVRRCRSPARRRRAPRRRRGRSPRSPARRTRPSGSLRPPRAARLGIRVLRVRGRPDVAVRGRRLGLRQDRRGRTGRARASRSPSSPSRGRCSPTARARSRRGSSPARSRAGSWRPSSSARPRSPTRRSRRAREPAPT